MAYPVLCRTVSRRSPCRIQPVPDVQRSAYRDALRRTLAYLRACWDDRHALDPDVYLDVNQDVPCQTSAYLVAGLDGHRAQCPNAYPGANRAGLCQTLAYLRQMPVFLLAWPGGHLDPNLAGNQDDRLRKLAFLRACWDGRHAQDLDGNRDGLY